MSQTKEEKNQIDEKFYKRADAHIALANSHIDTKIAPGDASNSFMYAASRFNAWVTASSFKNGEDMKKEKQEVLDFFVNQYKLMLEENFDNYAENYNQYMGVSKKMVKKGKKNS